MKNYVLTYGRRVFIAHHFEAPNDDDAWEIASALEDAGSLGLATVTAVGDDIIKRVEDDDNIWDIQEVTR